MAGPWLWWTKNCKVLLWIIIWLFIVQIRTRGLPDDVAGPIRVVDIEGTFYKAYLISTIYIINHKS